MERQHLLQEIRTKLAEMTEEQKQKVLTILESDSFEGNIQEK
mgnify:FL=1|jgi:hypothetical protein